MLQEASGAAGHPSYRRYHYGSGPLLVEDGANRRFISTDALGSTTDLTTTGATVASMRKYDAWGQYRNDTAPLANEPKLGFTGHQYDPETGLVYARARYYDPDLGRFLSRDSVEGTIGDAPSLHRFMYVRGNPLRYTDPTGHLSEQTATWAMNREWQRYQAAERGSPQAAQALQRYQFYRSELQSAQNNRIFNEEVTFPLAADTAAGMVLGPLAKAYRGVRVALGVMSAASGMSDFQKASQEGGEQRTADIISGTGKVVGAGLMLAPEISKGASAVVEKVRALGEKVRAAFTVAEDSAAPGAVVTPEQAPGRPAWGSVGAARAGDPFDPEPPAAPSGAPEPEVQEFLSKFRDRYPGRQYQSGHYRTTSDGRSIEIDFETDNAIVEIKKGRGSGLAHQVEDRMDPSVNPDQKVCIGIACSEKGISPHAARSIEDAGGLPAGRTQIDDVIELIKPEG